MNSLKIEGKNRNKYADTTGQGVRNTGIVHNCDIATLNRVHLSSDHRAVETKDSRCVHVSSHPTSMRARFNASLVNLEEGIIRWDSQRISLPCPQCAHPV